MVERVNGGNDKVIETLGTKASHFIINPERIICSKRMDESKKIAFDYNESYLDFFTTIQGYGLDLKYYFLTDEGAIKITEPLISFRSKNSIDAHEQTLSREGLKKVLNPINYDSLYLLNGIRGVYFIHNRYHIESFDSLVLTDEEIIQREKQKRLMEVFSHLDSPNYDELNMAPFAKKSIEKVRNVPIISTSLLGDFTNILITSRNGEISLYWIKLLFKRKNRYSLTLKEIPLPEPNIDDAYKLLESRKEDTSDNPRLTKNLFTKK